MSLEDHRFLKGKRGQIAGSKLLQDSDKRLKPSIEYNTVTGIVKDVISNPYDYLKRQFGDTDHTVQDILTGRFKPEIGTPPKTVDYSIEIKNSYAIDTMPINSIFAYIVDDNLGKDKGEFVICYPFFPPHLSLPLKAGEYVWIKIEKIGRLKYYYWMCRKVGHRQIDDVNYTNFERIPEINRLLLASQDSNKTNYPTEDSYSLKNAKRKFKKSPESAGTNSPVSFHDIFANSYSHVKEFTGEPVPRLAKDCGDLLLQGSNNAGIHLTTEKFSEGNIRLRNSFSLNGDATTSRKAESSAIDLFVGRKNNSLKDNRSVSRIQLSDEKRNATSEGKLNFAANNANNSIFEYVETDKIADVRLNDIEVYDKEIKDDESDATDIAARLYLSRNSEPDLSFGSLFGDLKPKIGESIVTYAENNRVIGEKETRIVSKAGRSYIDLDEEGNITLKSLKDSTQQFLSLSSGGNARLHAVTGIQISQGADTSETPQISIFPSNMVLASKSIEINADSSINLSAGTSLLPGETTIISTQPGGVIVKSSTGNPGALLTVQPIQQFIETWKDLTTDLKIAFPPLQPLYAALGGGLPIPGAAIAVPIINALVPVLEEVIEQLSTKFFFAE